MANPWENDQIVEAPKASAAPWEQDAVVDEPSLFSQSGAGIAHSFGIGATNTMRGVGRLMQAPGESVVSGGVAANAALQQAGVGVDAGQIPVDAMGNPTGEQSAPDDAALAQQAQTASEARRNAQTAADMAQEARQRNVVSGGRTGFFAREGKDIEDIGTGAMQAHQQAMETESPMMVRQQKAIQDAEGFGPTMSAMAANPLGTLGTTAQSIPDMVLGMGAGRVAGLVAKAGTSEAVAAAARAAGDKAFQDVLIKAASNPNTLASATKLAADARAAAFHGVVDAAEEHATHAAEAAGLGSESLQSGWQTTAQVVDALQQRKPDGSYAFSDSDLRQNSPRYKELVDGGVDPEQARRYLSAELSDATAPLAALWTGLAGKLSGAAGVEARVAMGQRRTLGQTVRSVGKETLEEALQNPGENYEQYLAQAGYDPSAKYDFGGSVAQGIVGGGLQGAAMHGAGYANTRSMPAEPTPTLAGRPIDRYSTDDLTKFAGSGVLTQDVQERVDAELARRNAETQLPASETPGQAGQGEALDAEVQRFAQGSGISPDGAESVGAGSPDAGRSAGDLGTDLRNADGGSRSASGSPASSGMQAQSSSLGVTEQSGALNNVVPPAVDLRQQALDRAQQPAPQAPAQTEEQNNAPATANRAAGPLDQMAAASVVLNRAGVSPVFTTDDRSRASGVSYLGSERARNIAGLAVGQQSIKAWSDRQGISSAQTPLLQPPPPEVERAAYTVADAIHQATGNRPVLFHDPRPGAVDGFAINGKSYVNTANLEQSIHFTAFHEAWHVAEQRAGQGDVAAAQFVKVGHTIFDMISDEGKRAYAQKVLFAHQLGDGGSMTIDEALAHPQLRSEMIADFFGKRAEDIRFLSHLAQRAPLSFGGFVRSWMDSLTGIIDRFKASRALGSRDVDPYIRKLSHAKAVAASALIQWRKDNPNLPPVSKPSEFYQPSYSLRGLGRNEAATAETGGAANAPTSDIGHRRMESGVYVGAPSWVGSSPQRLAALRSRLYKLAMEGKSARHWYEESSRSILELANGDKQEAAKIVGLLAIYSPNATVPANTSMALTAYFQFKAGLPIKAGLGAGNAKAEALLREGKWWSGIKTNSFFQNLMSEIEPSTLDKNVATMDMWMALAFDYGKKKIDQGPTYRFMEREIARLGEQLHWPARQVQAAVWSAIKGRVESTAEARKAYEIEHGIASRVSKFSPEGKLTMMHMVARGQEHAHFRTATRFGMERAPLSKNELASAAYSFATALRERTVQMSWEATPGAASGVLPGLLKAPIKYQFQYLIDVERALLDENGHDAVARAVGLPGGVSINGLSAWQGNVGAGAQTFVAAPFMGSGTSKKDLKPEAYKLLDAYSAARGLILNQEAVVYHAPVFEAAKKDHNGLDVLASRPLNEDEIKAFYNLAYDAFGTWEIAPAYQPQGLRVLNFVEGLNNERFQDGLAHVLAQLPEGWGGGITDARRFKSVGNYVSNNWQEQPNGEGYRAALSAVSPDLQERVAGLQARVEAVNERYSRKYGWGPATREQVAAGTTGEAGRPSFSTRQGAVAGRPAGAVQFGSDAIPEPQRQLSREPGSAAEQLRLVKARDFIRSIAPSFSYNNGKATVKAGDAAAADAAIALEGGKTQFAPAIEKEIVNPVKPGMTVHEKIEALNHLTAANRTLVHAYLRRIDQALGTESKDSVKLPERIAEKAARPQIRVKKPWHDVEHIRDSYRMKTVIDNIDQLAAIVPFMNKLGTVVKPDLAKMLNPKEFGWRIAVFDIRMPNGQLVEHYMTLKELEEAKKEGGHQLFEQVRNLDLDKEGNEAKYEKVAAESRAFYQKAFDAYLARTGQTLSDVRASLQSALARLSDNRSTSAPSAPRVLTGEGETHLPSEPRIAEKPGENTKTMSSSANASGLDSIPAFSRRQQAKANPSIDVPPTETRKQAVQRVLQDKFNRMRIIQEWAKQNGAKITPAADVYTTEERMYGRISTRTQDFREKTVKPLVEAVQKAGYTMEQVAEVLHAMHAQERNAQIAKINPQMQDGGSGMTNARATQIMGTTPAALQVLAERFQKITDQTKDILLRSGIISQEMADAWDNAYKHYVPLKGDEEAPGNIRGTGPGLSVNERQKRAMGHTERDEKIVENILKDHERAIYQAERNRVGQSMLLFATEIANPNIVTVDKPVKRAVLMPKYQYEVKALGLNVATFDTPSEAQRFITQQMAAKSPGANKMKISKSIADRQVQYMATPQLADNEATVYVNGHAIRMQFNDPVLAREYKNGGMERLNKVFQISRAVQTYLSRAYTGYNPAFIFRNMFRDFGSGTIKITGNFGAKVTASTWAHYPRAMAHLLRYSWSGKTTPDIQAYRDSGGSTGAAYLSDIERIGQNVKYAYEKYQGVMAHVKAGRAGAAARVAAEKTVGALVGWIEHLNMASENAMRLALFNSIRDHGGSIEEAASAAKNSTVNFNRKGEWGPQMSALYLFYNPSIQDSASVISTLYRGEHKKQAWGLIGGMVGLAYMLSKLQWGGSDDDYERWKKIPDSIRDKNLIIRTGKDTYVTIPIPFGFGWFHTLGNTLFALEHGEDWNGQSINMAANLLDHFSPVGNPLNGVKGWDKLTGKELAELMPGFIFGDFTRDAARIAANRNAFGGPIIPDAKQGDPDQPHFLREWRSTKGTLYDAAARGLSDATGGSDTFGGKLDFSPETFKFWMNAAAGGTGQFLSQSAALLGLGARALTNPDDPNRASLAPERNEIPIARDYMKQEQVQDQRRAFYDAKSEAMDALHDFKRAAAADDEKGMARVDKEKSEVMALAGMAQGYSKMVKAMRDDIDAISADKTTTLAYKRAAMKSIEREEGQVYDQYLHEFIGARRADDLRASGPSK